MRHLKTGPGKGPLSSSLRPWAELSPSRVWSGGRHVLQATAVLVTPGSCPPQGRQDRGAPASSWTRRDRGRGRYWYDAGHGPGTRSKSQVHRETSPGPTRCCRLARGFGHLRTPHLRPRSLGRSQSQVPPTLGEGADCVTGDSLGVRHHGALRPRPRRAALALVPGSLAGAGSRPRPGDDRQGGDARLSQHAPPPLVHRHPPTPPSPGVRAADLRPRKRHEFSAQATSSTGREPGTRLPAPARRPSSSTVPKATVTGDPTQPLSSPALSRGQARAPSSLSWSRGAPRATGVSRGGRRGGRGCGLDSIAWLAWAPWSCLAWTRA